MSCARGATATSLAQLSRPSMRRSECCEELTAPGSGAFDLLERHHGLCAREVSNLSNIVRVDALCRLARHRPPLLANGKPKWRDPWPWELLWQPCGMHIPSLDDIVVPRAAGSSRLADLRAGRGWVP